MKKIDRRNFIKGSLVATGAAFLSVPLMPKILKGSIAPSNPDIVTIAGNDPMSSIELLLAPLGGIRRFVKSGNSVGILVNSPWVHPGTYTSPDVTLAFVKLAKDAGAEEIVCFKPAREGYWEESRYYEEMKDLIAEIKYADERTNVAVPKGVDLHEIEVFKAFMDIDTFVNIPVAKHHNGTIYSGTLKGLMGVTSSKTNRFMHSPDGEYTYSKERYLSQCIADLSTVRKPDLCLIDAIECCTENGPRGPGQTVKPNKLVAGIDPVATDVYAAKLMGFEPNEIQTFKFAAAQGVGNADLAGLEVLEL
ncbi:MAG: DUF362 domain-containing protein [Bacteroidota bacterium]|nr:DUF362 domain-containing protein [Bacteroidota bacterium]